MSNREERISKLVVGWIAEDIPEETTEISGVTSDQWTKLKKRIDKLFKSELSKILLELEKESQDVVYVASEKDKKLYSNKASKAVPLELIRKKREGL